MGCIFAEMVNGRPLFPGKNKQDQLERIFSVLGDPTPEEVEELSHLKSWSPSFLRGRPRRESLQDLVPGLEPKGVNLLEVRPSAPCSLAPHAA